MAKRKEEEPQKEISAEVEPPEVTEPEKTTEEKTPTPDEQVTQLQAQINQLTQQLTHSDDSYKGLQRQLNKKDADLKQFQDVHTRIEGLEDTLKILGGMVSERLHVSDEEVSERKTDYRKQWEDDFEKQRQKREAVQLETQRKEYNRQADEAWTRAQKTFANDEDALDRVEDLLRTGRLDRAMARIEKAEGKTPVKTEEPSKGSTESEEEIFERVARKRGLLKAESLTPSGRAKTPEQVLRDWVEGNATEEEYAEARKKLKIT